MYVRKNSCVSVPFNRYGYNKVSTISMSGFVRLTISCLTAKLAGAIWRQKVPAI